MLVVVRRGHQQADVAADDFRLRVAEQPLGAGVEGFDVAAAVDHDDAVDRRVDDRQQPGVQVLEVVGAGVDLRRQVIGAMQELGAGRARFRVRGRRPESPGEAQSRTCRDPNREYERGTDRIGEHAAI